MFQQHSGLQSLLKDVSIPSFIAVTFVEGSRHYTGLEEAILKNIDAVKTLSKMTRFSLGPHGKYNGKILLLIKRNFCFTL
jgi:hypothetical protein